MEGQPADRGGLGSLCFDARFLLRREKARIRDRCGLRLASKQVRSAGTRKRAAEYRVDLQELEQVVADSEAYFTKMKPPAPPMGEFDLEGTVANLIAA